jgi:hypothetical protein
MSPALPRIARFLETSNVHDGRCPHCGAPGHILYRFVVEDGRQLAAMRACVKTSFSVSRIAAEELRLRQKAESYRRKRGWTALGRRDQDALLAIDRFYAGQLDERACLEVIEAAKESNQRTRRRHYAMRAEKRSA